MPCQSELQTAELNGAKLALATSLAALTQQITALNKAEKGVGLFMLAEAADKEPSTKAQPVPRHPPRAAPPSLPVVPPGAPLASGEVRVCLFSSFFFEIACVC